LFRSVFLEYGNEKREGAFLLLFRRRVRQKIGHLEKQEVCLLLFVISSASRIIGLFSQSDFGVLGDLQIICTRPSLGGIVIGFEGKQDCSSRTGNQHACDCKSRSNGSFVPAQELAQAIAGGLRASLKRFSREVVCEVVGQVDWRAISLRAIFSHRLQWNP